MHCTPSNFHSIFLNTNPQEVQWIHNSVGLLQGLQITLHIQIPTSHFAQVDCGNVMIMSLLPEVPVVVMQQQQAYFICVVPAKLLDKSKAAGMFPFAYKQAIHGHRFWACLMCSAVWNGCSLQCQHTVKPPHPSHLEPFSQKCLLEQNAGVWVPEVLQV